LAKSIFLKKKNSYLCAVFSEKTITMSQLSAYTLPLKSLSLGKHEYDYHLDSDWFAQIEAPEIRTGDLLAKVVVNYNGREYEINFQVEGKVQVPCDRCLADMDIAIDQSSRLVVKMGDEYVEESDEVLVIPESEGEWNIAWFLYEIIALALPLKRIHEPGQCDKAMSSKLKQHLAKRIDDEEDDDMLFDEDDFDEASDNRAEAATNPIWDALKNLKFED
jgi:uncharacterized metal-binding protein YceD (DUF177 family)